MIAPLGKSAPVAPDVVQTNASLALGDYPKLHPAPFNATAVEQAVDALRSSDKSGWPALAKRVQQQLGVGVRAAEEILKKLAEFLRLPHDLARQLDGAAPAPCDYDRTEADYQALVASTVAEAPGTFQRKLRATLIIEEATRHLTQPHPRGADLPLCDAHREMVAGTKLARHAMEIGRRRVDSVGRLTRWHAGKLMDRLGSRFERPTRLVGSCDATCSLDRMLQGDQKHLREVRPYDPEQRINHHTRNTAGASLCARRHQEAVARAEARSRAWTPSPLTIALQDFVTGRKPVKELSPADLTDVYQLKPGRAAFGELSKIRRVLKFREGIKRLMAIDGHPQVEIQDAIEELAELHDVFLRSEAVRKITGGANLKRFMTKSAVTDDRTRALRMIALSANGIYLGHDLAARVESPAAETIQVQAELEAVPA